MGKTPKKDKTPRKEEEEDEEEGRRKQLLLSPIATPLAGKKLAKKALKAVKKASGTKGGIRRGVKEVVKAIKKEGKGLCIIAGNISPLDVIAHVPILCEEKSVPYIYVPSKEELGQASLTKRPTSIVLINVAQSGELKEAYDELEAEMIAVAPSFTSN
eukprot:scaffold207860_cov33-Tisochrysis_lutea.AAC.1